MYKNTYNKLTSEKKDFIKNVKYGQIFSVSNTIPKSFNLYMGPNEPMLTNLKPKIAIYLGTENDKDLKFLYILENKMALKFIENIENIFKYLNDHDMTFSKTSELLDEIKNYPFFLSNKKSAINNIEIAGTETHIQLPPEIKSKILNILTNTPVSHTNYFPNDYDNIYKKPPYLDELKGKINDINKKKEVEQDAGRHKYRKKHKNNKTNKKNKTSKSRIRVSRNMQRYKTKSIKKKRRGTFTKLKK